MMKSDIILCMLTLLSIILLLNKLYINDLNSVIFFIVVAYLTVYFSKNMIIVLTIAIISTNLLMSRSVYEGMREGHTFKIGAKVIHEGNKATVIAIDDKEGTYTLKFDEIDEHHNHMGHETEKEDGSGDHTISGVLSKDLKLDEE